MDPALRQVMNSPRTDHPVFNLMVLAPNWLGDVVMHSPLLALLDASRQAVAEKTGKQLHLSLGVRKAWAELFTEDPRVDSLIPLERNGGYGAAGRTMRLVSAMKRGRFDAVILCPPSLRAGIAAWAARIPVRIGYRTDGRSPFLSRGLTAMSRGDEHYSLEMIRLGESWLSSLGLEPPVGHAVDAGDLLPGCRFMSPASTENARPFWVVAPGTTYGEAKSWPLARVKEFVALATGKAGVRIVMLGDQAARGFTEQLRAQLPLVWGDSLASESQVVDLTGKTGLTEAVSVLKAASAFVGNDSGLMHVAAALGKPTVGVFGSSNPEWTAPLGPFARALTPDGFSCRPCYLRQCNQAEFCLDTVQAAMVMGAVLELTEGSGSVQEGI